MQWTFYGRRDELRQLAQVLARPRFFFARISGRRRIGKTTLVHEALRRSGRQRVLYLQVPDSGSAGVLSTVRDACDTFALPPETFPRPDSLRAMARLVRQLVEAGYVVVLDEFQYFVRKALRPFTSYLQAEVDALSAHADRTRGGLIVLGSVQAEMQALLQHRHAPLYNRTTDDVHVSHLDVVAVAELLREHGSTEPMHLLFLWNLFEGVPKFYRDCYEQGVLVASRSATLERLFFDSSAPLRFEAENWFLKELRGRYDTVLKYIARNPGREHADILAHVCEVDSDSDQTVSMYLKTLHQRLALVEPRQPSGSKPAGRRRRYYLRDNFLQAWLDALAAPVSGARFLPTAQLVPQADGRLAKLEGLSLERMVWQLWERLSRDSVPGFAVTEPVCSWWSGEAELDVVAVHEPTRTLRLASCKRAGDRLVGSLAANDRHIAAYLKATGRHSWHVTRVAVAPSLTQAQRRAAQRAGYVPYALDELIGATAAGSP